MPIMTWLRSVSKIQQGWVAILIMAAVSLSLFVPGAAFGLERAAPAEGDTDGKGDKANGKDDKESGTLRKGANGEPSYYTLPNILVNLNAREGRPYFLQLKLTLEAADHHVFDSIEKKMPRLNDALLLFLRELHLDDLIGTSGGYRLRLELLRRLNIVLSPQNIDAVLIEEMLIQ